MERDWNYVGIFLDEESTKFLLDWCKALIPSDWKSYAHHMTLAYNNKTTIPQLCYNYYKPRFGEKVELKITHLGLSDKALAARIEYGDEIMNRIPHITIAVSPEGKPVDSNEIKVWSPIHPVKTVTGEINVFRKN